MKNIEIFKAITAVTLARLYERFPMKMDVVASEMALSLDDSLWSEAQIQIGDNPNHHEIVRHKSPGSLAAPTIEWMESAGLISVDRVGNGTFYGARLTARGLEAVESEAGRGSRLMEAAKSVVTGASKQVATEKLKELGAEVVQWCANRAPIVIAAISQAVAR